MEVIISLLVSIFTVILLLPIRSLPSTQLKRTIQQLSVYKKYEKTYESEGLFDKIAALGLKLVKVLRLSYEQNKHRRIQSKLQQAGLKYTPERFLGLKIGMLFLGLLYGLLLSTLTEVSAIKVICYMSSVALFFWPNIWLENKIRDRRHIIQKEMPFVLSSMAVIVESGMSLMQAITEISSMKDGALIEEFQVTLLEIEVGISRTEAFERMIDRVQVTELSIFLSSLIQSIEKGSSGISNLLKKQSDEMWMKRKEKARALAEKASIKLFLPLLLFVLPAMMIFILTPAVLSLIKMF